MRAITWLTSTVYSLLEITAGLLLHPYQTAQQLVEEKVFVWMVFVPTILLGLVSLLWWITLSRVFVYFPYIGSWAFILLWSGFFFILWQILLLYLVIRFWITLR